MGDPVSAPQLAFQGVPEIDEVDMEDRIVTAIHDAMNRLSEKDRRTEKKLKEAVRIAARKTCRLLCGKNAITQVLITRVP